MEHNTTLNREGWLTAFAEAIAPIIKQRTGLSVPLSKTRLACGFPRTGGTPSRTGRVTTGQCLMGHASGLNEIMINPIRDTVIEVKTVDQDGHKVEEGHGIAETVIHELLHAALDVGVGHKAPFARAAKAMGLQGKPTSTNAGPELVKIIEGIIEKIGPYPHQAIKGEWGRKQGTRLLKVACPDCGFVDERGAGYTIRVTQKWIDVGLPICPCGEQMVAFEGESPDLHLKAIESTIVFHAPSEDGKGIDERFHIRRSTGPTGEHWTVVDYGEAMVEINGHKAINLNAQPRIVAAESRQDALDMISAVREGLFTWDYLEDRVDEDGWDEGEDDGSNPLADDDPDLDALLYVGDDETETPDYPEDQDPGEWVHPRTGKVTRFDYDAVAASRER